MTTGNASVVRRLTFHTCPVITEWRVLKTPDRLSLHPWVSRCARGTLHLGEEYPGPLSSEYS